MDFAVGHMIESAAGAWEKFADARALKADTCYSGHVLGTVRTSGLINELASAENGAVVFAPGEALRFANRCTGEIPQGLNPAPLQVCDDFFGN